MVAWRAHSVRDVGTRAVVRHLLGDAANDIGVICAALIIQLSSSQSRFYADPALGIAIAAGICYSAYPIGER